MQYKYRDYQVTLADGTKLIEYATGKYDAKVRCLRRHDVREEDIVSVEPYETVEPPVPSERAREYIKAAQAKLKEA